MSKYKYSETERQINSVLKHQDEDLKSIHFPSLSEADATVAKADALLRRLGYQPDAIKGLVPVQPRKTMVIPTWEQCCAEAETHVGTDCELESLFTEEELRSNELAIKQLNEEFNAVHRLDAFDISIAALAGLVGAAAPRRTFSILCVGAAHALGSFGGGRTSPLARALPRRPVAPPRNFGISISYARRPC